MWLIHSVAYPTPHLLKWLFQSHRCCAFRLLLPGGCDIEWRSIHWGRVTNFQPITGRRLHHRTMDTALIVGYCESSRTYRAIRRGKRRRKGHMPVATRHFNLFPLFPRRRGDILHLRAPVLARKIYPRVRDPAPQSARDLPFLFTRARRRVLLLHCSVQRRSSSARAWPAHMNGTYRIAASCSYGQLERSERAPALPAVGRNVATYFSLISSPNGRGPAGRDLWTASSRAVTARWLSSRGHLAYIYVYNCPAEMPAARALALPNNLSMRRWPMWLCGWNWLLSALQPTVMTFL